MVDYRKLLKWYITYVGAVEGTTFLSGKSNYSDLTPEENAALDEVSRESDEEWFAEHPTLPTR